MQKIDLKSFTESELKQYFKELGHKPFRTDQVLHWMYNRSASKFSQMDNVPKGLREELEGLATLRVLEEVGREESMDGTVKWLYKTHDGYFIETVLIPRLERNSVCVSTQVGCRMGCKFCRTARMGLKRHLESGEILEQFIRTNEWLVQEQQAKLTNIIYMGMGEPLLNFIPVIESAKIMKEQLAYGLSRKRITISTSGITPQIDQLHNEVDVSLAISLHAPTNELRDEIVPINKKYPISELMKSCYNYLNFYAGKRSITIEYVLIDGVNDSEELAIKLAKLLSKISCKINLIPFNPFDGSSYKRSSNRNIETFKNVLIKKGFITTLRVTRGDAVDGACGQLVGRLTKSIKGKKLISHQSIS